MVPLGVEPIEITIYYMVFIDNVTPKGPRGHKKGSRRSLVCDIHCLDEIDRFAVDVKIDPVIRLHPVHENDHFFLGEI